MITTGIVVVILDFGSKTLGGGLSCVPKRNETVLSVVTWTAQMMVNVFVLHKMVLMPSGGTPSGCADEL